MDDVMLPGSGRGFTSPDLPEEEAIFDGEDVNENGVYGNALTDLQFRLYRVLKRSMDRQTCVAGVKSRISYSGLRQRVYQTARRGFAGTGDSWGGTPRQMDEYIRLQVDVLERRGLIKRVGQAAGFLVVEFVVFKQFRDVYFSAQKKLSANYPQNYPQNYQQNSQKKATKNNDLVYECGDSYRQTIRSDSAKLSTYPEVSISKERVSNGNNRASVEVVGLTDLQNSYFDCIASTQKFKSSQLMDPRKLADYRRMLAVWEAAGVDPERLPVALQSILADLQTRNGRAYSPLYFEDSVLRWMAENRPRPVLTACKPVADDVGDGRPKKIPYPPHWLDEPALRAYQRRWAAAGAPSFEDVRGDTLEAWWGELKIWCRRYSDGLGINSPSKGVAHVVPLLEAFRQRESIGNEQRA